MPSTDAMWYCHECNAEMRPLMAPDPHCASCHGTFVEKIENPEDDPRAFHEAAAGIGHRGGEDDSTDVDEFIMGLQTLFAGVSRQGSPAPPRARSTSPNAKHTHVEQQRVRFEINSNSGRGGTRTFTFGGPNTLGRSPAGTPPGGARRGGNNGPDAVPGLGDFVRNTGNENDRLGDIPGALMAQYLLTLLGGGPLGGRGGGDFPLAGLFGSGPEGEEGRWGDYVFNQEALDRVISQMMENSNASKPVPAPEDVIEKLPREVIEEGSSLLDKECAVCKDAFKLENEDPDEQVVVTLPCKHPFHESCILPWLKSSGTCPVCRYALVPQPQHHGPGEHPIPGPSSDSSSSSSTPGSSSTPDSGPAPNRSSSPTPPGAFAEEGSGSSARTASPGGTHQRHGSGPGEILHSIFNLISGGGRQDSSSGGQNGGGSGSGGH